MVTGREHAGVNLLVCQHNALGHNLAITEPYKPDAADILSHFEQTVRCTLFVRSVCSLSIASVGPARLGALCWPLLAARDSVGHQTSVGRPGLLAARDGIVAPAVASI